MEIPRSRTSLVTTIEKDLRTQLSHISSSDFGALKEITKCDSDYTTL